jgi:hypothetical protein
LTAARTFTAPSRCVTANTGTEKTSDDRDRFIITINLSGDQKLDAPEKIVIDKQVAPLTAAEAKEALDAE